MRFRKGSKVEVLSKSEVPSGSWRCGEVISGNGHNYDVRYTFSLGVTGEPMVERVSRKVIRPCPPPVDGLDDWITGDIVEVFDNMSWKVAIIMKVLRCDYFFVRLVGSCEEIEVHKSELRVRQSWCDNEWIIVGKAPRTCEEWRSNRQSTSRHQKLGSNVAGAGGKRKMHFEDYYPPTENNICFQESRIVSSRSLKWGSPDDSHVEACTRHVRKSRATENYGRRQQVAPQHPSFLPEKVDAVASPRYLLGEKYMHASFYNQTGFSVLDMGRAKPNGNVTYSNVINMESSDAEASESSVGSCSSTSKSLRFPFRSMTKPSHDPDYCSDAESFCVGECPLPSEKELAAEVHKIELNAYRGTMEALFASGPLSWEQEELMTNLRLSLHISNDEHLRELKSLVSTETNLYQ